MEKETAKSMWQLCKISIMHMIVGGRSHSKKLYNHCGYTLLNGNGISNVVLKLGYHVKKRMRCPHGHVPVLVGQEGQKYYIPITHLSHPTCTFLLEITRFESGFKNDCEGGILVTCDVEVFENLIHFIQNNLSQSTNVVLQDILDQLEAMDFSGPHIFE